MQSLVSVIGLGLITFFMYRSASARASESAQARTRLIAKSSASIAIGAVLAFWAPTRVPETPGSPGTLVIMLVFWIVGGCLIYTGAVSLPAAIRARPGDLPDFQ